jgi:hypothetical protein
MYAILVRVAATIAAILLTNMTHAQGSATPGAPPGLGKILDRLEYDRAFADEPVIIILESARAPVEPSWIATRGGVSLYRRGTAHEISVPAGRLPQLLRELPAGMTARRPYPHHVDAVTSQGVALTGAGDFQALGMQGAGVAIGVIDQEFGSLAASQTAGELPLSLNITDYTGTGTGGGTHGTNVAEIVHDMAPGAALYLGKIATDVQLGQALDDMIAAGVKVIVHSMAWFAASFYDGTGPLCDIANQAESAGVQWVNAAGNSRRNHYLAPAPDGFKDSDLDLRHDFGPGQNYNTISLTAGTTAYLYLNWDAYPATKIDYDLFLYDGDPDGGGTVVDWSTAKPGSGPFGAIQPFEQIEFTPPTSGTYYIVITKASAGTANVPLTLFSIGAALGTQTTAKSLMDPAVCNSVIAVAAANLSDQVEDFSSEGPTTDGRNKPEVTGPDRVQTSLTSVFAGTSAAAPHAGGATALLMARYPGLPPAQIRPLLLAAVKDLNTPGFDLRTGNGRVSLDADGDGVNHDGDNCRLTQNANQLDADTDAIGDACDNCTLAANADQRDTDNDSYGNRCDADFNQNNYVNITDLGLFKTRFGTNDADADLDGNGLVNINDLGIFKSLFGKAPGPSGLTP